MRLWTVRRRYTTLLVAADSVPGAVACAVAFYARTYRMEAARVWERPDTEVSLVDNAVMIGKAGVRVGWRDNGRGLDRFHG